MGILIGLIVGAGGYHLISKYYANKTKVKGVGKGKGGAGDSDDKDGIK